MSVHYRGKRRDFDVLALRSLGLGTARASARARDRAERACYSCRRRLDARDAPGDEVFSFCGECARAVEPGDELGVGG